MLYPEPVGAEMAGQLQLGAVTGRFVVQPLSFEVITMLVPAGIFIIDVPETVPAGETVMTPPLDENTTVYIVRDILQVAETKDNSGVGVIVTVVWQLAVFPHVLEVTQVMVDTPGLKIPLASLPVPVLVVAPVMLKLTFTEPPQLLLALAAGMV